MMFFSKRRSPWVLNGGRERPFKKQSTWADTTFLLHLRPCFLGGGFHRRSYRIMSTTCLGIPDILESLDEEVRPLHEYRRRWHGARYVLENLVRVVGYHVIVDISVRPRWMSLFPQVLRLLEQSRVGDCECITQMGEKRVKRSTLLAG